MAYFFLGPLTDERELALQMRIQELFITLDKVIDNLDDQQFWCEATSTDYCKCKFPMTSYVRLLVGRWVCNNFKNGGMFHFRAPFGALVFLIVLLLFLLSLLSLFIFLGN